jgi:hypothetical protein
MLRENDINKKGNDAKEPRPVSGRGHEDIDPPRIFLLSTPSTFHDKETCTSNKTEQDV